MSPSPHPPQLPNDGMLFIAAGRAVFFYDFLITFPDEVQYVWGSRRSLVKTLFLFCRYGMITPMVMSVIGSSGLFSPSARFCQVSFLFQITWYGLIIGGWNWLLAIRVHAILSGSANLKRILTVLSIGVGAIGLGLSLWEGVDMAEGMTAQHQLCIPGNHIPPVGWMIWVPMLVFNLAMFTMGMAELRHQRYPSTALRDLLIRDGFLYWSVLSTMQAVNLVLYLSNNPVTMFRAMYVYEGVGSNIVSRLVLNLRKFGDSTTIVDLDADAAKTTVYNWALATESRRIHRVPRSMCRPSEQHLELGGPRARGAVPSMITLQDPLGFDIETPRPMGHHLTLEMHTGSIARPTIPETERSEGADDLPLKGSSEPQGSSGRPRVGDNG